MSASEGNAVHAKLLEELRKRSMGIPGPFPDQAVPAKFSGLLREVDMLRPLAVAAWRCKMVRSFLACVLGTTTIAIAAICRRTSGYILSGFGAILLSCAIRRLPGGVPFLKVHTKAGFHCSREGAKATRNMHIQKVFEAWHSEVHPCPWSWTGELCTVLPFLCNGTRGSQLVYERMWLDASDGERFAIDWVFPPQGFLLGQPVVVLLTGLAPAKHWTAAGGFIADAAWYLTTQAKMSVVVVVARGTMDTEVQTNLFHGARVTDLRQVIVVAHESLLAACGESPILFGAGYSMGAIILANYCGKYGGDCKLQGAVHFSGLYDAVANMKFEYSAATWQAYLAYNLKHTFFNGRSVEESSRRGVDVDRIMSRRVSSVVDIDREFVAVFNGYSSHVEYYKDMSLAFEDKWKQVVVPVLAVAARDDPITHCDGLRVEEFAAGNENLLFLVTDRGGHVGWPQGWLPWRRGWDFCNEAIRVFVEAVREAEQFRAPHG